MCHVGECRGKGGLWVTEFKMQLLLFLKPRPYFMSTSEIIYIKCVLLTVQHANCYVHTKQLIPSHFLQK